MINVIQEWEDDLIWCPSQCYLRFQFKQMFFVLYLRWRTSDPWTATLIHCKDNEFETRTGDWFPLAVNDFTDDQLDQLKVDALSKTKEYLNRNF